MNGKKLGAQRLLPDPIYRAYGGNDGMPIGAPIGYSGGLTKRELFAAFAMQGLLSAPLSDYDNADTASMAQYKGRLVGEFFAHQAVCFADSLLAELAKGVA